MQFPVDSVRIVATVLLVLYHVIGPDSASGLHIIYPSAYRLFADFFVDFRMPFFALISGMVYAFRPPVADTLLTFAVGKIHRLIVPGAIATALFLFASTVFGLQFAMPGSEWRAFVFPYAHYWFLQAIFVILVFYAIVDVSTQGRAAIALLAMAILASFYPPFTLPSVFSIDRAAYLAPYFALGVVFVRFRDDIARVRLSLLAVSLALLAAGTIMNVTEYAATGRLAVATRDVQSLLSSFGACGLAALSFPVITGLRSIGAATFTIYLYHVFGTSLARRGLEALGVDNLLVHVVLGFVAGIAIPLAIHGLASQAPLSRRLILGVKAVRARRRGRPSSLPASRTPPGRLSCGDGPSRDAAALGSAAADRLCRGHGGLAPAVPVSPVGAAATDGAGGRAAEHPADPPDRAVQADAPA